MAKIEDTTFQAVGASAGAMHGNPAVMAAGFEAEQQKVIVELIREWAPDVPVVFITAGNLEKTLGALSREPDCTGYGEEAKLPPAVVCSGLNGQQLHDVMREYRAHDLPRPLWATVTPTSESWSMKYLLVELLREREALRQANAAKNG